MSKISIWTQKQDCNPFTSGLLIHCSLLRSIPSECGCVRIIGCTVASLSADQSGQRGMEVGAPGNNSWRGDQCLLLLFPSDGGDISSTLRSNMAAISMNRMNRLTAVWLLCLCTVPFVRPSICQTQPLSFCLCSVCQTLKTVFLLIPLCLYFLSHYIPFYFFSSLFFLLCHSDSSISAAFTESSCSPARKKGHNDAPYSVSGHISILLYLCSIAPRV